MDIVFLSISILTLAPAVAFIFQVLIILQQLQPTFQNIASNWVVDPGIIEVSQGSYRSLKYLKVLEIHHYFFKALKSFKTLFLVTLNE